MSIQTEHINYFHNDTELTAYVAWDDNIDSAIDREKPAVLICHDAMGGKTAFEHGRAEAIAKLGYVGVAIDAYGKDSRARNAEEAYALMGPLTEDRRVLRERLACGVALACAHQRVDATQLAVMGYCFGGLCALEMARSGADLKGAISFHGLLSQAEDVASETILAKLLVLHGWSDPLVPQEQVLAFAEEMNSQGVDWQLVGYGHGLHGFSNPLANDPANGIGYDADIDRRSWLALTHFLAELFIKN